MAFPIDLRRCQILGLAGTAFLALGGESAGALPVREILAPSSAHAALGLVGVYFGVVLLIAAWLMLGRLVRSADPPTPRALLLVLAVWATPLLIAPPLFSRDVYSYLAQGAMVDAHIDVYSYGPSTSVARSRTRSPRCGGTPGPRTARCSSASPPPCPP